MSDALTGKDVLALELVSWRKELAVSALEERVGGKRIAFPINLPNGFDLEKRVKLWVEEWQNLPYISPYENAFHLAPNSDQAEKWTVAVLHELMWIMVSKKTERENLNCLGDYLGFGRRFEKALKHHPGIFYISNKIRTQTVVLREAYRKDFLVEKHPLMGMRHRYIHLLNKVKRRRNPTRVIASGFRKRHALVDYKGEGIREDESDTEEEEEELEGVYDSKHRDENFVGLVPKEM